MSWNLHRARALATSFMLLWPTARAHAAPCGRPDVDLTFPPDGAEGVPDNARLSAHYAAPALYTDEGVTLTDSAGSRLPVTVSYDAATSLLRAVPVEPLARGPHRLEWPGLRSVGSGGLGRGSSVSFSVSGRADGEPPSFSGLSGISWDLARDRDPCLNRLQDRFVFRLKVGVGADDSGAELLALSVFQTRDPLSPEQTEPALVALRAWPKNGELELQRGASQAGDSCFAAVARDLLGNVSGGGEREVCITTKMPPFFEGCAVAPGRTNAESDGGANRSWLALLGLSLLRRGQRAKARPLPLA